MFFKLNKLKRYDFKFLDKNKSVSLNSEIFYLNIYYLPEIFNHPKVVFSCSKKVSLSAVVRNKLRRRGFSVMASFVKNIKSGYVLMFSYKKKSENSTYDEVKSEITRLINLSKVLN